MLSVLDLFRIGIGPSSSHTVGPMRIAQRYRDALSELGDRVARCEIRLLGSLAFTGVGHGTPDAVLMGLLGHDPETIDLELAHADLAALKRDKRLALAGELAIEFDPDGDLKLDYETPARLHPNAMLMRAYDSSGRTLAEREDYSTGGGFIASKAQLERPAEDDLISRGPSVPYPFTSASELLQMSARAEIPIAELVLANEDVRRPRSETLARLDAIIQAMHACIERGLNTEGVLPGGLRVGRRASALWRKLSSRGLSNEREALFDWLNVYAMAVNEENASGGRVVTAPTNGAAGILPAVLRYYCAGEGCTPETGRQFLLTAGAIGLLYKQRASISGAEMGCQGEVGVACSMAAGALAAVWGASPAQVATAAEIGMEHNLGLTCDPVGGLVQIPCIERNAVGAVKAANAARLALHGSENPKVSLDQVIETMRQTGLDMSSKYKETSQGGLAVNVVEC